MTMATLSNRLLRLEQRRGQAAFWAQAEVLARAHDLDPAAVREEIAAFLRTSAVEQQRAIAEAAASPHLAALSDECARHSGPSCVDALRAAAGGDDVW